MNRQLGGGPDTPSAEAIPSRSAWLRYLIALAGGVLISLVCYYALLFSLAASDNLPPPAFSNSLCVDEKLKFLREHKVTSPDLLVVGSSVAWRHFDGAAMANNPSGSNPLNGGFCGLKVHQSVHVADWLLERQPSVRQVVMIVAPQDFSGCQTSQAVFDRKEADRFVYGDVSRWGFYLRYFSPSSLLRNAQSVQAQRANRIELDPLVFNRYGDGPMDTAASRETLKYGLPEKLDAECFAALHTLAKRLQGEGRKFTVISTPLHPDWKTQQDPQGLFLDGFNKQIVGALRESSGQYWDANAEWKPPISSFTDAIHLRWSAAQSFSIAMAQHLRDEPLAKQSR